MTTVLKLDDHMSINAKVRNLHAWRQGIVRAMVTGPSAAFARRCIEVGIVDEGLRVHGASALTFWGLDTAKRHWVMPSSITAYNQIKATFDLAEVECSKRGKYLKYKPTMRFSMVCILHPYLDDVMDMDYVNVEKDGTLLIAVASMAELRKYFHRRAASQKRLFAASLK